MVAAGSRPPPGGAAGGPGGGRWQRLRGWFAGAATPAAALADDGTLVEVGRAFDPAQADSAVVEQMRRAGVDVEGVLLLRHHLRLPDAAALDEARRLLAPEGYTLTLGEDTAGADPAREDPAGLDPAGLDPARAEPAGLHVRASRPQVVTGLSAAQERSRMAGLAQRLGGEASGWTALAPPPAG